MQVVAEANRSEFRLAPVPSSKDARPSKLMWVDAEHPDVAVTLSMDWDNGISYVDVRSEDREIAGRICDAFLSTGKFGNLEDHLAAIASNSAPTEQQIVKIGLAAVVHDDDPRVSGIVLRALRSPDAGIRRAATYSVFVLQWKGLVEALRTAVQAEQDDHLRELMNAVLTEISGCAYNN